MFSIIAHTRKKDAEFINIGHKLIKLAEASFDVGASPEIIFNFIWDFTRFNIYALNGDTISETLDLLIEAVYEGEDPNDPENWVNGLIY
jgi:hypothetical protein